MVDYLGLRSLLSIAAKPPFLFFSLLRLLRNEASTGGLTSDRSSLRTFKSLTARRRDTSSLFQGVEGRHPIIRFWSGVWPCLSIFSSVACFFRLRIFLSGYSPSPSPVSFHGGCSAARHPNKNLSGPHFQTTSEAFLVSLPPSDPLPICL